MTAKLKRVAINLPEDLYLSLEKYKRRLAISVFIVEILDQYFSEPNTVKTKDLFEGHGQLITIPEALKKLKISRSTLHGLMNRSGNPIPSVRIGKSRRIPLDKLLWWIDNLNS
jgi:predicted DNA-binding transcriptional regulator AlpA